MSKGRNSSSDTVIGYKHNDQIISYSGTVVTGHVKVSDSRGILAEMKAVNGSTVAFIISGAAQVLLLKITSRDNVTLARKVVNKYSKKEKRSTGNL